MSKKTFVESLALIFLLIVLACGAGCATVVADGFPVQGTVINTIDKTTPGKTVTTEQLRLTAEAAKYNLQMVREVEETKRIEAKAKAKAYAEAEKAKARAANPCGGCFMVASGCYAPGAPCGNANGGSFVPQGRGGQNYVYQN